MFAGTVSAEDPALHEAVSAPVCSERSAHSGCLGDSRRHVTLHASGGQVLADFLQGVLVASRLFSDELLCACLELLLSAPPSLMSAQVRSQLPLGT